MFLVVHSFSLYDKIFQILSSRILRVGRKRFCISLKEDERSGGDDIDVNHLRERCATSRCTRDSREFIVVLCHFSRITVASPSPVNFTSV